MEPRLARAAAVAALLLASASAAGQDRPSEEELFGAPPKESPAPEKEKKPAEPERPRPDEAELFGSTPPGAPPPPPTASREKEDPLRIGGQLYLRLQLSAQEGAKPSDFPLASPNLLDVFLDVRPNDRVRGFVLGRLSYDPTFSGAIPGLSPTQAAQLGLQPPPNPRGALDQLWANFDLAHTVFVTAGKQHVKWGVGQIWNPTDYLHRQPRNPLDVFDARTGTTMVRAHLPWESRGWNLYAVTLLEETRPAATSVPGTLGGVPAGGRGEVVLGPMELGADVLVGQGARPRYGLDVSAGVWDLDLYAEAALGAGRARWRKQGPGPLQYALVQPSGLAPQLDLGVSWSVKYSDEDAVTFGAEYFFQDFAYTDPHDYPFLLAGAPELVGTPPTSLAQRDPSAFTSFYLGRHYAGAFASLPNPGSWNNTTFRLSVLGNLSDTSFIARLDHSVLVLTYLRVETYVAGHFGASGGEFRLGVDVNPQSLGIPPSVAFPTVHIGAPVIDLGVALRVSL